MTNLRRRSSRFTVLVCGSRDWTDWEAIGARLTDLEDAQGAIRLLHGAARGADSLAANIAEGLGFEIVAFPADWETHGKRAGFLRNLTMLDERPDLVLAFQLNQSRGTQHTIDQARRRRIPVEVIT